MFDGMEQPPHTQRSNFRPRYLSFLVQISYIVGLGDVWRFPYICKKHGGVVFFLPYSIVLLFVVYPLLILYLLIPQFFNTSNVISFQKIAPMSIGLPWTIVLIDMLTLIWYNMLVVYIFYYTWASTPFYKALYPEYQTEFDDMPWSGCHYGNSTGCVSIRDHMASNKTGGYLTYENTSTQLFFSKTVLNLAEPPWSGFEEPVLHLAVCLMLLLMLLFICLSRDLHSANKFYSTLILAPFVQLFALFVYVVTVSFKYKGVEPQSMEKLDWSSIFGFEAWKDAGEHIFFSYGLSQTTLSAIASHNSPKHNIFLDAGLMILMDSSTSFFSYWIIARTHFWELRPSVLVSYEAYTELLSLMNFGSIWAVPTFIMLSIYGFSSCLGSAFGIITNLQDGFPVLRRLRYPVLIGLITVCLVGGLPLTSRGGKYLLLLLERATTGPTTVLIVLLQTFVIIYAFGYERLHYMMLRMQLPASKPMCRYLKISWQAITPALLIFLFYCSMHHFWDGVSLGVEDTPIWLDLTANFSLLMFAGIISSSWYILNKDTNTAPMQPVADIHSFHQGHRQQERQAVCPCMMSLGNTSLQLAAASNTQFNINALNEPNKIENNLSSTPVETTRF